MNASAVKANGTAITCACRSPSKKLKYENSFAVWGITREGANQLYWLSRPG